MKPSLDHQIRDIYKLDERLARVWKQVKLQLSPETVELFEKYETDLINLGLDKSTRIKQLQILLTISRKINKNWPDVTKPDIDRLVREVMNEYGDVNGDETETSMDFKKILKLFFRWFKLGSRDHNEVGDPPETKGIRLKQPKDKITRENLLKEDDITKILHACGENLRDRAFIDVHMEAGTRPGVIKKPKTKQSELIETLKEHIQNKQMFLDDFEEHALEIIEEGEDIVSSNFWHALKAGAMKFSMPTQIVWPNTLAIKKDSKQRQDDSTIAWNFSVALHYKGSGFPWTMTRMKKGTCYVGISFFRDLTDESKKMRTSMAQIFTYTGEGLILRGDKFEWDATKDRSPHLDKIGAKELLSKAIELYTKRIGQVPERVVVHKSSKYWDEEKEGFDAALNGIKYYDLISFGERDIRFFRYGQFPPLRGSVIQLGKKNYLLYTRGYSPYLRTYPGAHVPLPLEILEHFGESPADTILTEILALSKMNWNSSEFSLAKPITVIFQKGR